MKLYTLADIDALRPCYDPREKVPADWSGTLLDILNLNQVSEEDRIWCVTKLLDDKTNRLFAVWCAREALKLIVNPDPRSVAACDIAERFANGGATKEELAAAWAAARAAAWAAAGDAARAAARAAQIEKLKDMIMTNDLKDAVAMAEQWGRSFEVPG